MKVPESETELDAMLSEPSKQLIDMMGRLKGDIMILGANGKMGVTLSMTAKRAAEAAGVSKRVVAVSRFSDKEGREKLEKDGIETISCDLLDRNAVAKLPKIENIIFMAGRKFGTSGGGEALTWAMNVIAPANVGEHFKGSRIVVFSTGCVYPLVSGENGGSTEDVAPAPVGEYAQSCLGRERVFQHYSIQDGTPVLLLRLNYAVDLRYGTLYDIASKVWSNEPVPNRVGAFNVLWQGTANNYALLALEQCASPANILNITGPETLSVSETATKFASAMGRKLKLDGTPEGKAYLNNASKAFSLFGRPSVSAGELVDMQAKWIMEGGRGLGKPTHFEVNSGKF